MKDEKLQMGDVETEAVCYSDGTVAHRLRKDGKPEFTLDELKEIVHRQNVYTELKNVLDNVAVHTLHLLWILDSEKYSELKEYFDADPRGLTQHIGEIQKHLAEAGCAIAQTGKMPKDDKK